MSITPLSGNNQYAISGSSYFPNKSHRYQSLQIKNNKARSDQVQKRKVQALSVRQQSYRRLLSSKNPAKRKQYQRMVDNILRHEWDQSVIVSEHGQFPSLPKESILDSHFPNQAFSVAAKKKNRAAPYALNEKLQNSFVPTKFQVLTDAQITTPVLLISGREQPLGGSEGTPEQYRIPAFTPNSAYGGTRTRYF